MRTERDYKSAGRKINLVLSKEERRLLTQAMELLDQIRDASKPVFDPPKEQPGLAQQAEGFAATAATNISDLLDCGDIPIVWELPLERQQKQQD